MKAREPVDRRGKRDLGRVWIVLLSIAALIAAGCGGGSGDGSSTATKAGNGPLTKAELIEQGDAICAKVYAVTESLNAEGPTKEAVRFANLHIAMIKDLLALGTPRETEFSYAEYTTGAHALEEAEAAVERMARRGDPEGLRVAESSSLSTFSMFQGLAGQYGFKECAG
jgi:hypothetical protein